MEFLYIFGQPGAGKSTLVEHLVRGLRDVECLSEPVTHPGVKFYAEIPFIEWRAPGAALDDAPACAIELGKGVDPETGHRGTDRCNMYLAAYLYEWLPTFQHPWVFGEGERLGAGRVLATLAERTGRRVVPVYLDTPDGLCAERRSRRERQQRPAWVKGRITKTRRLAEATGCMRLDGTAPLGELEARLGEVSETARQLALARSAGGAD